MCVHFVPMVPIPVTFDHSDITAGRALCCTSGALSLGISLGLSMTSLALAFLCKTLPFVIGESGKNVSQFLVFSSCSDIQTCHLSVELNSVMVC